MLSYRVMYDEAWNQLFDLVASRNALLRALNTMSRLAMEVTPASGMVIEFEVTRAEELIVKIEQLTGEISAGIREVNTLAERCGAPSVQWQNIATRPEP
ncbi:MAG TPA: hypothetical protein VF784_07250 [Anaerolineales bacterium]